MKVVHVLFICLASFSFGASSEIQCHHLRPSFGELINLLNREIQWMGPKLFDDADPLLVAEGLILSKDVNDLSLTVGMSANNEQTLKKALEAISKNDVQYFLNLGMSSCSWNEVRYLFQKLLNSGFSL